jgi:hypothetical protein
MAAPVGPLVVGAVSITTLAAAAIAATERENLRNLHVSPSSNFVSQELLFLG